MRLVPRDEQSERIVLILSPLDHVGADLDWMEVMARLFHSLHASILVSLLHLGLVLEERYLGSAPEGHLQLRPVRESNQAEVGAEL